jgi:hypothetical protein
MSEFHLYDLKTFFTKFIRLRYPTQARAFVRVPLRQKVRFMVTFLTWVALVSDVLLFMYS